MALLDTVDTATITTTDAVIDNLAALLEPAPAEDMRPSLDYVDLFENAAPHLGDPPDMAFSVVFEDEATAVDLPFVSNYIFALREGTIRILMQRTASQYVPVVLPVSPSRPLRVRTTKIFVAGTTAEGITVCR